MEVAPLTHQHYQGEATQVITHDLTPGKFIHIKGKKPNTKTWYVVRITLELGKQFLLKNFGEFLWTFAFLNQSKKGVHK